MNELIVAAFGVDTPKIGPIASDNGPSWEFGRPSWLLFIGKKKELDNVAKGEAGRHFGKTTAESGTLLKLCGTFHHVSLRIAHFSNTRLVESDYSAPIVSFWRFLPPISRASFFFRGPPVLLFSLRIVGSSPAPTCRCRQLMHRYAQRCLWPVGVGRYVWEYGQSSERQISAIWRRSKRDMLLNFRRYFWISSKICTLLHRSLNSMFSKCRQHLGFQNIS